MSLTAQVRATMAARREDVHTFARRNLRHLHRPARHLDRLLDLFARAEREPVRAVVSMPPGHGKTTTILLGLAWLILRTPGDLHGYVSYTGPATRAKSLLCRDYATGNGMVPHEDLWSWADWRNVSTGGLLASGINGRLTGDRITGCLVVDDPFKNIASAESAAVRELVSGWFDSVAYTRLVPQRASCIVVHTRWTPDDLIGRLRKVIDPGTGSPLWEVLEFPAVDEHGAALWPEGGYTLAELARTRAQLDAENPHLWPALYLQQPVPRGGRLFGDPARYHLGDLPRVLRPMFGADLAATARTRADHTAIVRLGVEDLPQRPGEAAQRRLWEVALHRWQVEGPVALDRLWGLQQGDPGVPVAMETSGLGKPLVQQYRRDHPHARVIEVHRVRDKYTAALPTAGDWNASRVVVPLAAGWATDHIRRAQAFTGLDGGDDDDIDALVNAREAAARGSTATGSVAI